MTQHLRERIVDTALDLAESSSWENVRLHHIADKLQASLEQIRCEFNEKEQIVDAWFDRADQAMLCVASNFGQESDPGRRIEAAMLAWLGELGKHQKPTRQMVFNKFEFGHIHYQVDGVMRISRTVQWLRETAGLEDTLPWRAFSEAGLTLVFLATFFYWMFDVSPGYEATRRFLHKRLKSAHHLAEILRPTRPSG